MSSDKKNEKKEEPTSLSTIFDKDFHFTMDDIFQNFGKLFNRNLPDLFNRGWPNFFDISPGFGYNMPKCRYEETDKAYLVNVEMPGVDKEKIKVTLKDGLLNVVAGDSYHEKVDTKDEQSEKFSSYSYSRQFPLPENASEDITSTYKEGILNIEIMKKELPKVEEKKSIDIEVK